MTKFDLGVKWVKVNPGSQFEHFLVVLPYTMLHIRFQGNRSSGSWKRRFFKVSTIYGHGGPVGHVTELICINFHSFSASSFHMNFGSKSLD